MDLLLLTNAGYNRSIHANVHALEGKHIWNTTVLSAVQCASFPYYTAL